MALVFINTKDEREKVVAIERDVKKKVNASIMNKYVIYNGEVRKILNTEVHYYYGEFDLRLELEGVVESVATTDYALSKECNDKFDGEFSFKVYSSRKEAERARLEMTTEKAETEEEDDPYGS